jgi:signal transduction histidine kinase
LLSLTGLIGSARLIVVRQRRLAAARLKAEQEKHRIETAEHRAEMAELQARASEAEKEIEKEQMRSRIASDLHDEIGSNLSTIAIISQLAADRLKLRQAEKQRLREIPRIARKTAESMRDIIWFIHPENDSMEQLLVKMRQTANLMLEAIDFDFNAPEAGLSFTADIDFRRNLYLIFKEILQNVIKHAAASRVEITLTETDGRLILQVSDNGVGIDPARENTGTGLHNFQRRAQALGGKIEIFSEKNQGTRVLFSVKIP